jgi:hypothetical protein
MQCNVKFKVRTINGGWSGVCSAAYIGYEENEIYKLIQEDFPDREIKILSMIWAN